MKLIVIAHPDKNSFTHEITKTISLRYAKNGTVYKVIDLYRTDLKQDYLYFKDILNIEPKELLNVKVLATYIDGKLVYKSNDWYHLICFFYYCFEAWSVYKPRLNWI